jgi:NitT/TauT family transport system permease protein
MRLVKAKVKRSVRGAGTRALQAAWGVFLLLAVWQGLSWLIGRPVLPGPAQAGKAFIVALLSDRLLPHLAYSTFRVLAAVGAALVLAIPAGIAMGRYAVGDRLFSPLVHLVYPVPKVAFLPVVVILLGVRDLSKVFLIGLTVFFQILVTTRDGARNVPRASVMSVKSLGATEWDILRHVVFPACLPRVFTALRIAVGTAVAVLFLTETFATVHGLGYYLLDAWSRLDYRDMFAGVIAMGLLGAALHWIVDRLEARLCPWQRL